MLHRMAFINFKKESWCVRRSRPFVLGFCACGCGERIGLRNERRCLRRYQPRHVGKNNSIPHSKEWNKNVALSKMGPKNAMWKGDKVDVNTLHKWIKRHLVKPDKCDICKKVPPYDLANKTGTYSRDFLNWYWLCRRCHMLSDGRMEKLLEHSYGLHRL